MLRSDVTSISGSESCTFDNSDITFGYVAWHFGLREVDDERVGIAERLLRRDGAAVGLPPLPINLRGGIKTAWRNRAEAARPRHHPPPLLPPPPPSGQRRVGRAGKEGGAAAPVAPPVVSPAGVSAFAATSDVAAAAAAAAAVADVPPPPLPLRNPRASATPTDAWPWAWTGRLPRAEAAALRPAPFPTFPLHPAASSPSCCALLRRSVSWIRTREARVWPKHTCDCLPVAAPTPSPSPRRRAAGTAPSPLSRLRRPRPRRLPQGFQRPRPRTVVNLPLHCCSISST